MKSFIFTTLTLFMFLIVLLKANLYRIERFTSLEVESASQVNVPPLSTNTYAADFENNGLLKDTLKAYKGNLSELQMKIIEKSKLIQIDGMHEADRLITSALDDCENPSSIFKEEQCKDNVIHQLITNTFKYIQTSILLYVYCRYNGLLEESDVDCTTEITRCEAVVKDVIQIVRDRVHIYRNLDTDELSGYYYLQNKPDSSPLQMYPYTTYSNREYIVDTNTTHSAIIFEQTCVASGCMSLRRFLANGLTDQDVRTFSHNLPSGPYELSSENEKDEPIYTLLEYLKHSMISRIFS